VIKKKGTSKTRTEEIGGETPSERRPKKKASVGRRTELDGGKLIRKEKIFEVKRIPAAAE